MSIYILNRGFLLGSILAALACGPVSALADPSDAMPLGAAAPAPPGFLEMCERTPGECLSAAHPTDEMLAEVRTWAGRGRWASVFQSAGVATAPAAIPSIIAPVPTIDLGASTALSRRGPANRGDLRSKARPPEQIRAAKDERRKGHRAGKTQAPSAGKPTATPAGPTTPAAAEPPEVTATPPPVSRLSTEALTTVTRRINRAIRRSSDAAAYGREDVWMLPAGRRPTGDCEDYVLAKRRALIEEGVDAAALSIAIVRTGRGEIHAVLLVATPEGEQVLDNLSPWVVPWREAPYTWLERQVPGQPTVWARAAA